MISALSWVARAAAKDVPIVSEPTAEELEEMKRAALDQDGMDDEEDVDTSEDDDSDNDSDEEEQIKQAKAAAERLRPATAAGGSEAGPSTGAGLSSIDAAMAELDMEHYDEEDVENGGVPGLFGDSKHPGMAYYSRPEEDPYLAKAEADSDSEEDDFVLKGSDYLILAARNEDDVSHLEVWVYEDADDDSTPNLYVHHDIIVPAFPLSLAWMDCNLRDTSSLGNLAAVGSISPGIEIWDLDVVDAVEPLITLGGELPAAAAATADASAEAEGSKKKKKKKRPLREGSHTDAVLGLSWNRDFRNVLASGSADRSVKVWDIATGACQHMLTHHTGKVQAVAWNPAEAPVLLSGGFDKAVALTDVRGPDAKPLMWAMSEDVEALAWNPHAPTSFMVSSEDGLVAAYDARAGAGSEPLFRLSAHDAATCALSFNPAAPNLVATASTDKKVKLWDIADNKPSLVAAQDLKVGACFTAAFCQEAPWLLAAGGAGGTVAVWDVLTNAAVSARYAKQLRG